MFHLPQSQLWSSFIANGFTTFYASLTISFNKIPHLNSYRIKLATFIFLLKKDCKKRMFSNRNIDIHNYTSIDHTDNRVVTFQASDWSIRSTASIWLVDFDNSDSIQQRTMIYIYFIIDYFDHGKQILECATLLGHYKSRCQTM